MDPFAPDWTETVLRPLASRANAGESGPHLSDELFAQLWPWAVQTADQMARRLPPTADGDALRGEVLLEILQATRRIDWHRYRTWPALLRSRLRNAWSTTARAGGTATAPGRPSSGAACATPGPPQLAPRIPSAAANAPPDVLSSPRRRS